jgi:hypothetical protein
VECAIGGKETIMESEQKQIAREIWERCSFDYQQDIYAVIASELQVPIKVVMEWVEDFRAETVQ